jgi:MoaA/NifB/PqqE/SkfB family radical SAM enzyme
MDFRLFQKIVDDVAQVVVKRVRQFLHGELLLHPQIVEMILYAKSKDLAIHLTTYGMALIENKINAVLYSGVNNADYFTFSILGSSNEVYEMIMKGSNYDKYARTSSIS